MGVSDFLHLERVLEVVFCEAYLIVVMSCLFAIIMTLGESVGWDVSVLDYHLTRNGKGGGILVG